MKNIATLLQAILSRVYTKGGVTSAISFAKKAASKIGNGGRAFISRTSGLFSGVQGRGFRGFQKYSRIFRKQKGKVSETGLALYDPKLASLSMAKVSWWKKLMTGTRKAVYGTAGWIGADYILNQAGEAIFGDNDTDSSSSDGVSSAIQFNDLISENYIRRQLSQQGLESVTTMLNAIQIQNANAESALMPFDERTRDRLLRITDKTKYMAVMYLVQQLNNIIDTIEHDSIASMTYLKAIYGLTSGQAVSIPTESEEYLLDNPLHSGSASVMRAAESLSEEIATLSLDVADTALKQSFESAVSYLKTGKINIQDWELIKGTLSVVSCLGTKSDDMTPAELEELLLDWTDIFDSSSSEEIKTKALVTIMEELSESDKWSRLYYGAYDHYGPIVVNDEDYL